MDVRLPPALRGAIASLSAGVGGLADAARRLSDGYRAERGSAELVRAEADGLAYALSRLPATYAAVTAAFEALAEARPELSPASLADLGAGPGTAAWAALERWPDIGAVTLIERNPVFLALSARLAGEVGGPLAAAERRVRDLSAGRPLEAPVSLAVLAYALTELTPDVARRLVVDLLALGVGHVVIVEPGTPRAFARLKDLRAAALAAGARVLAPCPHQGACPLSPGDWCHFTVRLPRSRQHLHLKGASVPFEDEPFSYLVLESRPAGDASEAAPARVIRRPEAGKHAVTLTLCRPDGTAGVEVVDRHSPEFRRARKLGWGDAFAPGGD